MGSGTHTAIATRITAAAAVATMRVRDIWRAVVINADHTLRRMLAIFDVTFTKVTATGRPSAGCDAGYRRVGVVGGVTTKLII